MPTSVTIPVFLLDVDGVINGSRVGWSRAPKRRRVICNNLVGSPSQFLIRWEPQEVSSLARLHREQRVEIRWCTTWGSQANTVVAPLVGLPTFPVAGENVPPPGWEWKLPLAVEVLTVELRDLIIVDDMLLTADSREVLTLAAKESGRRVCFVQPNSARGLRPEHFVEVEKFLAT